MNQLAFGHTFRPGAGRVQLGDEHPIATALDRLLLSRRSIEFVSAPRQEAILFGPDHLTVPLLAQALSSNGAPAAGRPARAG